MYEPSLNLKSSFEDPFVHSMYEHSLNLKSSFEDPFVHSMYEPSLNLKFSFEDPFVYSMYEYSLNSLRTTSSTKHRSMNPTYYIKYEEHDSSN